MIKSLYSLGLIVVTLVGSFNGPLAHARTPIPSIRLPLETFPISAPVSLAQTLLTEDLRVGLKVMQKEVRVYNYFNVPQAYNELQQPLGRAAYLKRYFDYVANRFWDLNYVTDQFINAGPGVYAAIDPSISKAFGNAVAEISLLPGLRLLNVVRPIKVREETLQALMNEAYIDSFSKETLFKIKGIYGFSRDTLKNVTTHSLRKFRKLIQDIFLAEGIDAIEYNWDTDLSGFCRKHNYSAFVIIKSASSDVNNVGGKMKMIMSIPNFNLPKLSYEEYQAQNRILTYRQMLEDIQSKRKAGIKIAPELKSQYFPNPAELNDVINKTYSCEN